MYKGILFHQDRIVIYKQKYVLKVNFTPSYSEHGSVHTWQEGTVFWGG